MGQITTKLFQSSCIYDFSVSGGAVGTIPLGISLVGGNTICFIRYRIITALATAAVNIDAGYGFNAGTNFVKAAHTVAVLNAAIGLWLTNDTWNTPNINVTNLTDMQIYLSTPNVITAGRMLFSFTVMQHPM